MNTNASPSQSPSSSQSRKASNKKKYLGISHNNWMIIAAVMVVLYIYKIKYHDQGYKLTYAKTPYA